MKDDFFQLVTTLRVVWIEMSYVFGRWDRRVVTTLRVVWIEIAL